MRTCSPVGLRSRSKTIKKKKKNCTDALKNRRDLHGGEASRHSSVVHVYVLHLNDVIHVFKKHSCGCLAVLDGI